MANIKSQIKRIHQAEQRRVRNKSVRSALKTFVAKADTAIESRDKATAEAAVSEAVKRLDTAADKGVIHANNAANKKSRLMEKLAGLS